MLRLLLDEHISGAVAQQLRAKQPAFSIVSLTEWENGAYLGARDEILLRAAHEQGLTLVTYDLRTIVPLLKTWGETGVAHGGVILVDEKTIVPNDFGGLVTALLVLYKEYGELDWVNHVFYLTAPH